MNVQLTSPYLCLISFYTAWKLIIQEFLNSLNSFIQQRWNNAPFDVKYNVAAQPD